MTGRIFCLFDQQDFLPILQAGFFAYDQQDCLPIPAGFSAYLKGRIFLLFDWQDFLAILARLFAY